MASKVPPLPPTALTGLNCSASPNTVISSIPIPLWKTWT
nr:unnamed protein product [Callosobruchus chinensis]